MDAKKILEKVRQSSSKTRFTVSIDEKLFEEFREICGDRSISPVVEEMVREFVESAKKQKK